MTDRRIIVAGAGHGGIVAAYYLAEAGYRVEVYEKKQREALGYDQKDSIHLDGFELSGIPVPEAYCVKRTPISFRVPGTDLPPLVQGDAGETYNVEIDRKALYDHLIGLAEGAGVQFHYGVEILGPMLLGSRVVGVKTANGDMYADLVIDACGLYSPVRSNLPAFLNIEKEPGRFDMLHAYRAYFTRNEAAGEPEHKYLVSVLAGEFCGIMWAITNEDHVDVLIGSMYDMTDADIEEKLSLLRDAAPQIGDTLLYGGRTPDIPIRQPLSLLVADGYAAIGDAAFMTVPLKGSGIGYSMRAGRILANCIASDENGAFTRETLWNYQFDYFEQIGFSAATIAVIKAVFPFLTTEDLEYFIKENVVSSEDLEMFGNEAGIFKILTSMRMRALTDKAKKIVGHPDARRLLLDVGKNVVRFRRIRSLLKEKPDEKNVVRWVNAYVSFFESLKTAGKPAKGAAEAEEKEENEE